MASLLATISVLITLAFSAQAQETHVQSHFTPPTSTIPIISQKGDDVQREQPAGDGTILYPDDGNKQIEKEKKPTVSRLPKVYGIGSLMLGVLLALVVIGYSIYDEEKRLDESERTIQLDEGALVALRDVGKAVKNRMLSPRRTAVPALYYGGMIVALSGLFEIFASVIRRHKARKGSSNVSMRPPLRGQVILPIGIILALVSTLGIVFSVHMAFLGLAELAAAVVAAGAALLAVSFGERRRYDMSVNSDMMKL